MSAPVLHPGIKTSAGPSPGSPASITRKETPSSTFTIRDDPVLASARTPNAPRQMTAIRSKTGREIKVIAVSQIIDERPDLVPLVAKVRFFQKDGVSRMQQASISE